jgi:hypothetical protein
LRSASLGVPGPPSSTMKRVDTPAVCLATRCSSSTLGRFSGSSASKPVWIRSFMAKLMATAVMMTARSSGIAGLLTWKSASL